MRMKLPSSAARSTTRLDVLVGELLVDVETEVRQLQRHVRPQLLSCSRARISRYSLDDRARLGLLEHVLAEKRRVRVEAALVQAAQDGDAGVEILARDEARRSEAQAVLRANHATRALPEDARMALRSAPFTAWPTATVSGGRGGRRASPGPSRPRAGCSGRAGARSASGCSRPGSAKPVRIVGMPRSESAGTSGIVPPERRSSGRRPRTRSKASWARRTAGASGGISPGGDGRPPLDLELGALGRSLAQKALERRRRSPRRPARARAGWRRWPRREPAGRSSGGRARRRGSRSRRPPGRRTCAGRSSSAALRVQRPRARPRRARARPGRAPATSSSSSSVGGMTPARSSSGSATTASSVRIERVHGVQRRAAEHAGVEVALAGPQADVEVDEPRARPGRRRARPREACRCRR